MRGYYADELTPAEIAFIREKLQGKGLESSVEGLFWLPVAPNFLTPLQKEHAAECGPYSLALELEEESLLLEFLVRAQNRMRCDCLAFASDALRNHAIDQIEKLLAEAQARVLQ